MPVGLGSRDPRSIKTLHHFLVKFRSQVSGDYLICRKDGVPLGPRAIQHILRRIGKRAGVKVSPHLLRHSAGTFWIRSGGNGLETSGSKLVHLTRVIL
ncbi:MAG: tyrosine-type recombinase/integrase [Candidatus Zixiibacteriota bacterium]